jgi:predicted ribonuclease YlaK
MPSLIPDTNALIYFPDISKWTFPEMNQFTIALMPTVLEELDSLKINHNNSTVREKAEKIIRMIKGYRNRGSLTEGVNIVKNKIKLVAIPIEPNGIDTLPWIDLRNNDDRFLCSTVDFIRSHICSPVIVVSRDINLQNKCEYALIPYKEPPEPISTSMGA